MANFCVISRILRKMYNFVISRNAPFVELMFFLNLNSRRFYFLSYVRLFYLHSGKRGSKDK